MNIPPDVAKQMMDGGQISKEDYEALIRKPAKNKYSASTAEMDGMTFHSRAESRRYAELKLLQQAGEISDLECQVRYRIEVEGDHICDYIADFRYVDRRKGSLPVVEDVKGYKGGNAYAIFRLKKKLMLAVHKINVQEVS